MIKASKGYTIVEVLLVLAISTTLLFAAITVFKGQQSETQFTQAVQDLNSKIINITDQVAAGTFPDSEQYSCTPGAGGPPSLSAAASGGAGTRESCLFLGRAIQVGISDHSILNIYTIVGNRNNISGQTATSINDAIPTAASITSGGSEQFVMNDTYTLGGGAKVSAVTKNGLGTPLIMAGFYTSLNGTTASSSGSLQLDLIGYPLANENTLPVKACIKGPPACAPQALKKWDLCVQNAAGDHTTLISVISNASGVTTQQTDNGC